MNNNDINNDMNNDSTNSYLFFKEYLEETKGSIEGPFTSLKWIEKIDDCSLKMLKKYYNNFDNNISENDINAFEVDDLFKTAESLITLETGKQKWESDFPDVISVVQYLSIFVAMEELKRKGAAKITGEGLLTNGKTTSFVITEKGKKALKSMNVPD